MSKALFGQSYYLRFDPKLWDAMQPYPPLGSMYAASYVRERGYDVALFDAMLAQGEGEWAAALDKEQPAFAIIYEDNFNYLSKMCLARMRAAAMTMIEMAHQRGCTVIVCGADASDHAGVYLQAGADFILLGEGEVTLGELLDALSASDSTKARSLIGLAYQEDGRVISNGRRPDIRDLDALPLPAWDLVDVELYRRVWTERHGYFSMNMVTTRGCPYHCNWCAKPIWGQRYNARSAASVASEMRWLKEHYSPDHIWFADDIMGLKPGWMAEFADAVAAQDARIAFKSLSRADLLLREGEIDALKRAGCEIVWIGAESGSQKILDAMEKGTKVEQIREAARRLRAEGVRVGFFLQFGYPGETMEDIELTLDMVRECQPDDIGMSVSYPLPGTKFFDAVKGQLGEKQHWIDSSDLDMMYDGPFATEFYRHLHIVIHKEFRARKTRSALKQGRRVSLRKLLALPYQAISLPFERQKLARLARVAHAGIRPLPPVADPEAAAKPTPQD
jgi:anaerobic magnesium-protoporphyrin IX monomethyl ester cyclase